MILQQFTDITWDNVKPKIYHKVGYLNSDMCIEIRNSTQSKPMELHEVNNSIDWRIKYETQGIDLAQELNTKLHNLLSPIWEESIEFYGIQVDFIETYEIKKYETGCYISPHIDQFYGGKQQGERKLTMIVQLSDDTEYEGGDLIVGRYIHSNKRIGSIIVIPSFYIHEVNQVTAGTRWSLNCWAWGPFWK